MKKPPPSNARQIPTMEVARAAVVASLPSELNFVRHTIIRKAMETLKCNSNEAERLADEIIATGEVVDAGPCGFTQLKTFAKP
jgi:hypothetical protein